MNLSVDRINSIDAFRIAFLKKFSVFGFPNKRTLPKISSLTIKTSAFVTAVLSKRVGL